MSNVLDFSPSSGFGNITAGMASTPLDPIEIDAAGKAYKAQVTDYAAVSSGQVVAQTAAGSGGRTQGLNQRQGAAVESVRGDIYIAFPNGTQGNGDGLSIARYSAAGSLLNTVAIDNTTVGALSDAQVILLSNNNVLVIWFDAANGNQLNFTIFDPYLNLVKAVTTIETASTYFAVCALSGGGFAVNYLKNSTATQRLAIYSNTGTVVFAAATWQTWTGTAGTVTQNIAQLSNGNILLLAATCYTTTTGLYFAIYNTAGAQQVASTQASSTAANTNPTYPPPVSVLTGFFAIGYKTSAPANKALVYSNAGALQGSATSQSTTSATNFSFDIINDGAQFFFMFVDSSGFWLLTLQTSGTAGSVVKITATSAANSSSFCAFYERGRIVLGIGLAGGTAQRYAVFNPSTNILETDSTAYSSVPTAATLIGRLIPGGDFTFIAAYTYDSAVAFYIGKYTATAFIGQAQSAVASGSPLPVKSTSNLYPTNTMIGTPSKVFDHSAATPKGSKGTLMTNGISL